MEARGRKKEAAPVTEGGKKKVVRSIPVTEERKKKVIKAIDTIKKYAPKRTSNNAIKSVLGGKQPDYEDPGFDLFGRLGERLIEREQALVEMREGGGVDQYLNYYIKNLEIMKINKIMNILKKTKKTIPDKEKEELATYGCRICDKSESNDKPESKRFKDVYILKDHIRSTHLGIGFREPCPEEGCNFVATKSGDVEKHLKTSKHLISDRLGGSRGERLAQAILDSHDILYIFDTTVDKKFKTSGAAGARAHRFDFIIPSKALIKKYKLTKENIVERYIEHKLYEIEGGSYYLEIDGAEHRRPVPFGGMKWPDAVKKHKIRVASDVSKNIYCSTVKCPILRLPDELTEEFKNLGYSGVNQLIREELNLFLMFHGLLEVKYVNNRGDVFRGTYEELRSLYVDGEIIKDSHELMRLKVLLNRLDRHREQEGKIAESEKVIKDLKRALKVNQKKVDKLQKKINSIKGGFKVQDPEDEFAPYFGGQMKNLPRPMADILLDDEFRRIVAPLPLDYELRGIVAPLSRDQRFRLGLVRLGKFD